MRSITIVLFFIASSIIFTAEAAVSCWEITGKDNKVSKVDDFWNIKSKLSEESILLIRIRGQEEAVSVNTIQIIELMPVKNSRLKFIRSSTSKGIITFIDGRKREFESDMNLISRVRDKKFDVQFSTVRSIRKCKEAPIPDDKPVLQKNDMVIAETDTQTTFDPDADVIKMVNGDLLNGSILTKELLWKATFGIISVNKNQIRKITLIRENATDGLLETRSSDKINGHLETNQISFRLSIGQTVEINANDIKAIHFGVPVR